MKDLGMKTFYRHDHKINIKKEDREDKPKRIKAKSKVSTKLKGGTLKPEDITDEYIDKLIN